MGGDGVLTVLIINDLLDELLEGGELALQGPLGVLEVVQRLLRHFINKL